ncbi:hypothetical protein DL546_005034 [Coniochaeta pulveracea]|uniref:C3H1-type domain-containing protein n=1 Tax=Coniochaeta pulveracea TaxID=177199 RepID=A0A420Y7H6_9PEZI|nr:hypothetical protein DL546_005034 [Coniochaeta pulveracea]
MSPPLRFYIIRPDRVVQTQTGLLQVPKALVPLIAADELPDSLDVLGVPRQLTPEQASQLTNLGIVDHLGSYNVEYVEESDTDTDSSTLLASPNVEPDSMHDGLDTSAVVNGIEDHKTDLVSPEVGQALTTLHPAERMKAAFPETRGHPNTSTIDQRLLIASPPNPATTAPSTQPSPQQLVPDHRRLSTTATTSSASPKQETIYCRHWVNKGTCKWGPLCRYAHTMPATAAGLQECGLTAFPPWWTDMMGLTMSSLTQHPGTPSGRRGRAQFQGLSREMIPTLSHMAPPAQMAPSYPVARDAGRMMVPGIEQMGLIPYERYGYGYGAGGRARERKRRDGKKEVHPVHGEGKKGKGKEIGGKAGLPGLARMETGGRRVSKGSVEAKGKGDVKGQIGQGFVKTPEKMEAGDQNVHPEQAAVPKVVQSEEKVEEKVQEKLVDV